MKLKALLIVSSLAWVLPLVAADKKVEEKKPETKVEEKKAAPADNQPLVVTPAALQEFQNRKEALDRREKDLDDRERALQVQEKMLQEKLKRMEELNQKMAERLELYKAQHEDKIKKLVTMVETMKPQAAASYLETVDPYLAVEVLTRIDVTRAAKIMNLVDKKKSARLTELYTGYRDSLEDENAKKEVPTNPPSK